MGGVLLALTPQPQSTTAWATGAAGEERLGSRLDNAASPTLRVLHDRRIPGSRANIDHLVICPAGVLVIDAKHYSGRPRPRLRVEGGFLTPRVETLMVGRRNGTKLVDGALKQAALVRAAVETVGQTHVPVRPMLCFVDADWPVVGGSFTTCGVEVLWPKKVVSYARQPGSLSVDDIALAARTLARSFPSA